jgi:hypothetical protein
MSCSHCGHPVSHEENRFCSRCGEPLGPCGEAQPSSNLARYVPPALVEKAFSALASARGAARRAGHVIQRVLEDPRLRSRIPGGSLTLLGAAMVILAILLSMLPFLSGIGVGWSLVMLALGLLVGANELRAAGQPPLEDPRIAAVARYLQVLERFPPVTRHPLIAQAFAVLTCTHALLELGFGITPLLWVLAAVVLGYAQGQALLATQAQPSPVQSAQGSLPRRMERRVVVGALVCTLALLIPWQSSSGGYVGGYSLRYVSAYSTSYSDRPYAGGHRYEYNPMYMAGYQVSGMDQPLASFTQLALVVLAGMTLLRRRLAALPPLAPLLLSAWLTVWYLVTAMSSSTGAPFLFLLGLIAINSVTVRQFLQARRAVSVNVVVARSRLKQ